MNKIQNPTSVRHSQGKGLLCRHGLLKKRALHKEEEEKRSLRGGEKEQKAKGGGKGEKEKSRRDQTEQVRVKYLVSFPSEML